MTKVVLVDDDQINSKFFSKRLQKRGYDVSVFNSGAECLEFFQGFNKSTDVVVVLDIVMPEMDGIEVLSKIREDYSPMELPVIVMSGKEDVEQIVECLTNGASDFIAKPANIDIAVARIQTQENLLSFYKGNLKKKQLETINSMVATFNHEINNPLTIALGSLRRDFSKIDERRVTIAVNALERISDIVKKIEKVTKLDQIEEEVYVENTKMIKIK
jgi:DNA-binding response OmpR family regulator